MTPTSDATLLRPYGLQTEQRTEPLGVGEPRPRLSWRLASDRRGAAQSAYRITAADRAADLDDPTRLAWDSGRRESSDGLLVPWEGAVLRSATRYLWRVEVWDETGAAAGSAQSWFETGLLHRDDWTAVWVGRDPVSLGHADPPTDPDPDPSTALPAAAAVPAPRVHGATQRRCGPGCTPPPAGSTSPGSTAPGSATPNWRRAGPSITADCSTRRTTSPRLLRAGGNVLAAVVADGWWCGYVGFDPRKPAHHYGDAPAFLAQLVLDFADGSRQVVATDAEWTERPGAIRVADLLMGQHVDARLHVPGWDAPGAASGGFQPVAVLGTDPGPLVAEPDHPVRVTGDLAAVTVDARGSGRFIVDFGQNLVGRARLTIRGAAPGRRIVLRHAEILADGELYLDNLRRAQATDVYTTGGAEIEVFEPQFTVHGFRYLEVDNYPGELSIVDVVARVLHSDTPWTGQFECSDPMVNQLQSNITWGQRGNFVAVPTDCPQRDERLGWLADAQIFAPTASRNADVSAFFARWMRDVVDGQDGDGAFRDVAPVVTMRREGAPAWGDAGVIIPWHLWRTYGDRGVLERSFDAMVAWVGHIRRHNPDLRWRHRTGNSYGDWLQVDAATPETCWPRPTSPAAPQLWRRPQTCSAATTWRANIETCTPRSGRRSSSPTYVTTAASRAALRPRTCWPWRSGCCRPDWSRRRSNTWPRTSRSATTGSAPDSSASRCSARCWPTTAGPTSPTPCCTRRSSRPGGTRSATALRPSGNAGTAGPTTAASSHPR